MSDSDGVLYPVCPISHLIFHLTLGSTLRKVRAHPQFLFSPIVSANWEVPVKVLTALLSLVIVGFSAGAPPRSANPAFNHVAPDLDIKTTPLLNEGLHFQAPADRQSCQKYYPLPDGYQNWTNCRKDGGGSACGGPEQCSCADSERLITFNCDQGAYHKCYAEKGNGCAGN